MKAGGGGKRVWLSSFFAIEKREQERDWSYPGRLSKSKPWSDKMQSLVLRKKTSVHSTGRKKFCRWDVRAVGFLLREVEGVKWEPGLT